MAYHFDAFLTKIKEQTKSLKSDKEEGNYFCQLLSLEIEFILKWKDKTFYMKSNEGRFG